ncbi:MAG: DUF1295 domain-containing protein [Myxococcota bacterium]
MEPAPALTIAIYSCAAFAGLCWLLSVITKEYSWVDRLWSITPVVYVSWFAFADHPNPRLLLMAALVALWGGRLTYNFARKGGYAPGGEDYRWAEVRKRISPLTFAVLNVVFVAGFQHVLLLLISLPGWVVMSLPSRPLGMLDAIAAGGFLLFWCGEALADEQQWRFQNDKKRRQKAGLPVRHKFLTTGLFRWSRHPNFFSEQAMWWCFYLFGVAAGAPWLHWSIIGAVLLTALFQMSTRLTEALTLRKYPEYARYQQTTSRLWPWPPSGPSGR